MLRRVKPLFLIDTDTASDDAVALIMALRSPRARSGITTVAGNVAFSRPHAMHSTQRTLRADVPFHGRGRPLNRRTRARIGSMARWFGDHGYPLPRGHTKDCRSRAIISTIESIRDSSW